MENVGTIVDNSTNSERFVKQNEYKNVLESSIINTTMFSEYNSPNKSECCTSNGIITAEEVHAFVSNKVGNSSHESVAISKDVNLVDTGKYIGKRLADSLLESRAPIVSQAQIDLPSIDEEKLFEYSLPTLSDDQPILPTNLRMLGTELSHNQVLQLLNSTQAEIELSTDDQSIDNLLAEDVQHRLKTDSLSSCEGLGLMPVLEDGLSLNGSDCSDVDSISNCSNLNQPSLVLHPDRSSYSQYRNELKNNSDADDLDDIGLMSHDLVRQITNDIRDIKRAISENKELPSVMVRSPERQKDLSDTAVSSSLLCNTFSPKNTSQHFVPQPSVAFEENLWIKRLSPVFGTHVQEDSVLTQNGSDVAFSPNVSDHHDSPRKFIETNAKSNRRVMPRSASLSSSSSASESRGKNHMHHEYYDESLPTWRAVDQPDFESDEDTENLLKKQYNSAGISHDALHIPEIERERDNLARRRLGRPVAVRHPDLPNLLIEGMLFRTAYLGSTQLQQLPGQPNKASRMVQAQEALERIKAPCGEHQPSVSVELFISTDKIMVLNANLQDILMDHDLQSISYIADIGNILVIMARHPNALPVMSDCPRRPAKIICHLLESDEAALIAQHIGQAFQIVYMEFLRANGIEDAELRLKDMDYQDVLNQQAVFGHELMLFSDKRMQKDVIIPKMANEPLSVVVVESGWGSMVPTIVLANMSSTGPAARCGLLNIGDQIISVNGISCVGLPLSKCQSLLKNCRSQSAVKLTVVPCPPVVEVLIKRPDVRYQLGFSVQNGVICSLLRGGIAERGGVRVGHRIIEINGHSVVAVSHEHIVDLLANGVGEIYMKTMPTAIFHLLTGQQVPHFI